MISSYNAVLNYRIQNLLKDFGVETEDELLKKLAKESETVPCVCCKKEISFDQVFTLDDDPYCPDCYRQATY